MLKTACKRKTVSLQSVNIGGTLEYGSKWKIPERIRVIERKSGSSSTIEVMFEGGWTTSLGFIMQVAKQSLL